MAELIPRPLVEIAPGGEILVKDKGRLPTGSFKARRLALAVSMAKELGVRTVAMPTNGNAGVAMAAYCAGSGIEAYVFCPEDTSNWHICREHQTGELVKKERAARSRRGRPTAR